MLKQSVLCNDSTVIFQSLFGPEKANVSKIMAILLIIIYAYPHMHYKFYWAPK